MNDDAKTLRDRFTPKEGKPLLLDRQMCALRFSPSGKILVAGGTDATVRRWEANTATFTPLPALTGHHGWVQGIGFSPEGSRLYSADSWGELRAWPTQERTPKPLWNVPQAHDGWIRGLAVSREGKVLATCGRDQLVRLWQADTGAKKHELSGHNEEILALAIHPEGKFVVSGDLQGVVKQWDVTTGKCVRELDARVLHLLSRLQDTGGVRALAFDPQGTTLACAGTKPSVGGNVQGVPTILFFDWATGKVKHTASVGNDGDGYIYDLHWHPAGFVMAVTSGNPGVGKLFFQRPGEAQPFFLSTKMANCHALAVHPEGKRLVVCATNTGSNGNGRQLDKNKEYPGNYSPLHPWTLPG